MKQHETHSRTGTIQVLLRACWQGFRTITMCRRRSASPRVGRAWPQCWWAAAGPGRSAGGRRQGLAGLRTDAQSISSTASAAGVEDAGGSGGPGRSAGGRRQGLAGLRADAPSRRLAARTASGRAAAHRHRPHKATHSTGARTRRPAPPDATTQTQLRSTCVQCRSARAARRSRRSSRSPRLRRRAGPRR